MPSLPEVSLIPVSQLLQITQQAGETPVRYRYYEIYDRFGNHAGDGGAANMLNGSVRCRPRGYVPADSLEVVWPPVLVPLYQRRSYTDPISALPAYVQSFSGRLHRYRNDFYQFAADDLTSTPGCQVSRIAGDLYGIEIMVSGDGKEQPATSSRIPVTTVLGVNFVSDVSRHIY